MGGLAVFPHRYRSCHRGLGTVRGTGEPLPQQSPEHLTHRQPFTGWHLDRRVLDFLSATGAVLDVDEYDMAEDDDAR